MASRLISDRCQRRAIILIHSNACAEVTQRVRRSHLPGQGNGDQVPARHPSGFQQPNAWSGWDDGLLGVTLTRIKAPVLDGLRQMHCLDGGRSGEIGDGAGDAQDAVIGAGG